MCKVLKRDFKKIYEIDAKSSKIEWIRLSFARRLSLKRLKAQIGRKIRKAYP